MANATTPVIQINEGNVGIGTVSPATELQIGDYTDATETITIATSNNGAGRINFYDQNDTEGGSIRVVGQNLGSKMYFSNRWNTDNDRVVFDLTTGNVGIGTTLPKTSLDIVKDSDIWHLMVGGATKKLLVGGQAASGDVVLQAGAASTVNNAAVTTPYNLCLQRDGGNVGIGTANPSQKLTVQGSNHIVTFKNTSTTANTYAQVLLQAGDATNYIWTAAQNSTNWAGARSLNIYTAQTGANIGFFTEGDASNTKLMILGNGKVGIGTNSPSEALEVVGNIKIQAALLSNQENTDVDTGTEVVAQVSTSTYTAAFFDFVIKKVGNIRSGTVYACHDGTNVEFTETSTQDLGNTSDVTLSVDKSGTNLRLIATVTSDDWIIKSLIRAI